MPHIFWINITRICSFFFLLQILNQIQCDRTRRLIENFGDHPVRPWNEIIRDKADSLETLDLIAKMAKMDPEERIDVNEAIQHPYFKEYYPSVINEQACPFKVKFLFIYFFLFQSL